MLTKESIVQRLLDEKKITAEEAVVLLKGEDFNGIRYVPVQHPWVGPGPTTPYQPHITSPYCDWTVRPDQMPLYGGTTCTTSSSFTTNENWAAK
jgi:hypothetical protein